MSAARRDLDGAETRNRILDAARALFVEHGIEQTTVRAIAGAVGITAPALYHHFPDKDALVRELVLTDMRRLGAVFARVMRVADPVERLVELGLAYVRFGLENPQHYRLLFMLPHDDVKQGGHEPSPEEDAYGLLHVTVGQAIRERRLGPDYQDADQVSQICWAAVHGLVSLHVVFGEHEWVEWRDVEVTAGRMLRALVTGMTAGA
ncbi:MAG TPA: TetR/AcrR family transcriptional regulator [Gemmatimonadales bacterium]|nr:TetR/AcrR family transcriptional regulator [Gemmatimonadales bacterium]